MSLYLHNWRKLLAIAWPLIVANSFWTLQMTIDRVFLGNASTEALGAAMAVMAVFWTPMALLQQTAGYVTTFVAQYLGSGQKGFIGAAFWQSIYFSLIGGLLFLLLVLVSKGFFAMTGHAPNIQKLEVLYFNTIAFSALPTAIVAAISGFFTGLGRTRMVMAINGVGLGVNALFDYLLIYGRWGFPELGIAGAGYATALAGFASAIFGVCVVYTKAHEHEFKIKSGWHWRPDIMRRFLKYGIPSGLQWALEGMAFTVFLMVIGRFPNGAAALAASSIAVTLMMLSILPSIGIAQSVMALVGQRLGEGRPDQAAQEAYSGVQLSTIYMGLLGATFVLFPDFYLSWFENKQDPELWNQVQEMTRYLLVFVAIFTLFDSFNFNLSFALKGAGDTRFVSLASLILPWPIMVLPTLFFTEHQYAIYFAWGFATAYGLSMAALYFFRFRGGKWKVMSVIKD